MPPDSAVTPFAQGHLLRAAPAAPVVHIDRLTGGGPVLVLTPHPDDESLGCGAAIATASRRGVAVTVAVVTDGRGSHPNAPGFPPERLVALRLRELRKAVATLTGSRLQAPAPVVALGERDQGIPVGDVAAQALHDRIGALIDQTGARAVWTTWEGDPHIDHQRVAAIARRLAAARPGLRLWQVPVWGRFTETGLSPHDRLHRFHTTALRRVKARAVMCHRSQMTRLITGDPQGFVMDAATRRHFIDTPELFIGGRFIGGRP